MDQKWCNFHKFSWNYCKICLKSAKFSNILQKFCHLHIIFWWFFVKIFGKQRREAKKKLNFLAESMPRFLGSILGPGLGWMANKVWKLQVIMWTLYEADRVPYLQSVSKKKFHLGVITACPTWNFFRHPVQTSRMYQILLISLYSVENKK